MNGDRFSPAEHRWTLMGLVFLVLLISAPSLIFPFGRDQGTYAYTAFRVLSGEGMYSEAYAFKPPGTIFVHMLSQILFGHSMFAIRVLDILQIGLSCVLLYVVAFGLFKNKWAAVICALLFARMYLRMGYWHTAQTDNWSILPTAASMLIAMHLWKRSSRGSPVGRPCWLVPQLF
jgi:4-amino-4-deoxy-L-arabinose transferase-like glycosyltransferase